MANYRNHLIDPTYFNDAIEEFAFDYDWYVQSDKTQDEYYRIKYTFEKRTIRGSLQTQGLSLAQSKSGNTTSNKYKFYCKSLYRIKDGDFIYYKGNWLHVDGYHEYDEWGVRECDLTNVELSAYKDLAEYIKYINGEIII